MASVSNTRSMKFKQPNICVILYLFFRCELTLSFECGPIWWLSFALLTNPISLALYWIKHKTFERYLSEASDLLKLAWNAVALETNKRRSNKGHLVSFIIAQSSAKQDRPMYWKNERPPSLWTPCQMNTTFILTQRSL